MARLRSDTAPQYGRGCPIVRCSQRSIVITNYSKALIDLDPARVPHEMRDENGRMLVIWPLGRTNKAIIVAIIRRAAAVNAAIFNPKMIRSAVIPLTKAPNA